MQGTPNKLIPHAMKNVAQWQLSRRDFVKNMFMIGVVSQIPFLSSCKNHSKVEMGSERLNHTQKNILLAVQNILFPNDGNGPSAKDVNTLSYLEWVLSDSMMDPSEKKYIINGIAWVDETAQEEYADTFLELSNQNKNKLIAMISQEDWGESWLSVILTFILEAVLSDPQYGGNTGETGWKWLQHYPGYPRPTSDLLYDNIVQTIRL